jgi:dienelactone hydrolase
MEWQLSASRLSRRSMLGATAALAADPALAEECRLGPAPHEKGPRVFMDMDQQELDASYDQLAYEPLLSNQALLGRLNFVLDIYRALDVLAKHPRVDSQRVALMGFSRGGQAALYASLKRFHRMWNRSGIEFAAYIPFYPDCATTFVADTEVADRPIRIFGGTQDDYNPIALCKAYVERLNAAGRDVQVTEYPTASHAFDNPLGPVPPAVVGGGQSVRHCTVREEPTGVLINASTREPFTYKDSCVEIGPHVGYDAAATVAVKASVQEILNKVFTLHLVGR